MNTLLFRKLTFNVVHIVFLIDNFKLFLKINVNMFTIKYFFFERLFVRDYRIPA